MTKFLTGTLVPRLAAALLVAAVLVMSAGGARALEVPRPLVDADWLDANRGGVVLLDVRKDVSGFTGKGHIEGARLVDYGQVRKTVERFGDEVTRMLPNKEAFASLMRGLGVNDDSVVVITTPGETPGQLTHATRLYWQLRYFGHDNVAILDGGNAQWAGMLLPLVDTPPVDQPLGTFSIRAERREMLATLTDVEETVEYGGPQLVDTRTLDYYLGLAKKKYVYAHGHIPYSKVFPYVFVTANSGPATFRPVDELKTLLSAMQVATDGPTIVYCNSGSLASSVWFVMYELLGNQEVRLFDGSMHQWTKVGNPVARNLD